MNNIFRISKNPVRAKALLEMAKERFNDATDETKTYKLIEQYYETIKELINSIMYINGLKTLSHKSLIEYLEKDYKKYFNKEDLLIIDELRMLRNHIMYYGKKVDKIFIKNNESSIKRIINKLFKIVEEK